MKMSKLSGTLVKLRKSRGLTLRQVETGTQISNAYLSQMETGKVHNPSANKLASLAEFYNIDVTELMEDRGCATKPNEKLESEDERAFANELHDGEAIKIHRTHWPDRLVILTGGKHLFIEFKRKGEKPRPGQLAVHNWLRDNGHPCFVAHSKEEAHNHVQFVRAIKTTKEA